MIVSFPCSAPASLFAWYESDRLYAASKRKKKRCHTNVQSWGVGGGAQREREREIASFKLCKQQEQVRVQGPPRPWVGSEVKIVKKLRLKQQNIKTWIRKLCHNMDPKRNIYTTAIVCQTFFPPFHSKIKQTNKQRNIYLSVETLIPAQSLNSGKQGKGKVGVRKTERATDTDKNRCREEESLTRSPIIPTFQNKTGSSVTKLLFVFRLCLPESPPGLPWSDACTCNYSPAFYTVLVSWPVSQDSLLVSVPNSWLKGCEFESQQKQRENFILQSQLCVLTLYSVSVSSQCYRSGT